MNKHTIIVSNFDFETLTDAQNAFAYAESFNPVPKFIMTGNFNSFSGEFQNMIEPGNFFGGRQKCVTFLFDYRLASWTGEKENKVLKKDL